LIALFLSAFVLFTKILFLADLMLAKTYTSHESLLSYSCLHQSRTRTV
jgi:hypothetical protein